MLNAKDAVADAGTDSGGAGWRAWRRCGRLRWTELQGRTDAMEADSVGRMELDGSGSGRAHVSAGGESGRRSGRRRAGERKGA
eukprot:4201587-Pleurochrysis_carterae.AAC.2